MDERESPVKKSVYKDINYEDRVELIRLINEEKWTIRAAAKKMRIKLCTAKYILYLFRRNGKIFQKKRQREKVQHNLNDIGEQGLILPVFVNQAFFCFVPMEQMLINLQHLVQN